MIALAFLRQFAKPILALLLCLAIYAAFKYHNHLQQSIGQLDQRLVEKQQQLDQQNENIEKMRMQVLEQSKILADLQKVQAELRVNSEQRQIIFKEIFINDQDAKSWANQPVPDAIRRMFNNTSTGTNFSPVLPNSHSVP